MHIRSRRRIANHGRSRREYGARSVAATGARSGPGCASRRSGEHAPQRTMARPSADRPRNPPGSLAGAEPRPERLHCGRLSGALRGCGRAAVHTGAPLPERPLQPSPAGRLGTSTGRQRPGRPGLGPTRTSGPRASRSRPGSSPGGRSRHRRCPPMCRPGAAPRRRTSRRSRSRGAPGPHSRRTPS
jgi:hypothetical protein